MKKDEKKPTIEQIDLMMRRMDGIVDGCWETLDTWTLEKAEEFIREEHADAEERGFEILPYEVDIVYEYVLASLREQEMEDSSEMEQGECYTPQTEAEQDAWFALGWSMGDADARTEASFEEFMQCALRKLEDYFEDEDAYAPDGLAHWLLENLLKAAYSRGKHDEQQRHN